HRHRFARHGDERVVEEEDPRLARHLGRGDGVEVDVNLRVQRLVARVQVVGVDEQDASARELERGVGGQAVHGGRAVGVLGTAGGAQDLPVAGGTVLPPNDNADGV